jgi:hypothetical protein
MASFSGENNSEKKYLFLQDYYDRFNKINSSRYFPKVSIKPDMKIEDLDLLYNLTMIEIRRKTVLLNCEIEENFRILKELLLELSYDRAIKTYRGLETEVEYRSSL